VSDTGFDGSRTRPGVLLAAATDLAGAAVTARRQEPARAGEAGSLAERAESEAGEREKFSRAA